jgi:hypothetical protein
VAEKRRRRMDPRGQRQSFDPSQLELVASVPYEANTFVMFVNSAHSIHAVRALAPAAQRSTNAWLRWSVEDERLLCYAMRHSVLPSTCSVASRPSC